jgi:hypothetical protein
LVLVTVVVAVGLGWALGGRLSRLEHLPYRGLPALGLACLVYLAGVAGALAGLPVRASYGIGLAGSGLLVLLSCVRSRAAQGTGLVAAGLLLNGLVVLLNGGMPVSASAARQAGRDLPAVTASRMQVLADDGTVLRALGDVIPVPLPFRPEVVSVGDLLVAAGIGQLVVTAMRPNRLGRRKPAPTARLSGLRAVTAVEPPPTPDAEFAPVDPASNVRVLPPSADGRRMVDSTLGGEPYPDIDPLLVPPARAGPT